MLGALRSTALEDSSAVRPLLDRLKNMPRKYWALAIAIIGLATLILPSTLLADQSGGIHQVTPEEQVAITYSSSWTLVDLLQHIDAGEVLAVGVSPQLRVSAAGAGGAGKGADPGVVIPGPLPLALLRDGQKVPVVLGVSYQSAMASLRTAGYSNLLSVEALSAASNPANWNAARLPFDWRGFMGVAGWMMLIFGVLAFALSHFGLIKAPDTAPFTPRTRAFAGGGAESSAASAAGTPGRPEVSLADVAGLDEAKAEVAEVIEFLRDPARFRRLGARVPRGLMLHGPAGTGKTMLARAMAAEAKVDFFTASGSEFVEVFVGKGAQRVRALLAAAKKSVHAGGGAVVFIDEIDALARKRGGPQQNDERESTLNQLLVAMDGFDTDERVVWVAATNRLDILDPAILRSGRFSRKIPVPLPDRPGREAILRIHAADKPLDDTIDLAALASRTAGYSGADLAELLNEAAILAARRDASAIDANDLRAAALKIILGVGRQRSMPPRERSIIAAHEAGHAVCGYLVGEANTIEHISLYQHGDALGVTVSNPIEDNLLPTANQLQSNLVRLMGGRAAEEICFADVSAGAADDFAKATEIARAMVERWGLHGDPEHLSFIVGEGGSAELAATREKAMRTILDSAYGRARRLLLEQRDLLERVGAYLFTEEHMDGAQFAALCDGSLAPERAELWAWRDAAAKPRTPEEIAQMVAGLDTPDPATR